MRRWWCSLVLFVGVVTGLLGVSGCTDEVPSGGYTSPGPTSTLPDNQVKVQSGTQGSLGGFDIRPSVITEDGEATVQVVPQEDEGPSSDTESETDPHGEVLTGREGERFEAYGHTFTFVDVEYGPMHGTVGIAIEEGE